MPYDDKQPQRQGIPGGADTPKPDANQGCDDKSDEATNLSNPYDVQGNGFKKHRDMTPI
jgi:hypothetical protein